MNHDEWQAIAVEACLHAGIEPGPIETLVTWDEKHRQNAAFRLAGQRILKIYGPESERLFHTERAALRTLAHNSAMPAPRIVAAGEPDQGHPYLLLTEISGAEMVEQWQAMSPAEQLAIAGEVGALFAAVHRLRHEELTAVETKFPQRREEGLKRDAARQTAAIFASSEPLSRRQRDDLLRFLHQEAAQLVAAAPAFAHTDLSHHHVYLVRESAGWRVSGIIDWAEAALGPPEWDLACLWHWTFNGVWQASRSPEWEAMQACLRAYYEGSQPPERLARRCLAAFLHSPWVDLVWPHFLKRGVSSDDTVSDLTSFMFAPEVFGPPD